MVLPTKLDIPPARDSRLCVKARSLPAWSVWVEVIPQRLALFDRN